MHLPSLKVPKFAAYVAIGKYFACGGWLPAVRLPAAYCLLNFPKHGVPLPSASLDDDPASALASFASDFEFASRAAPLHFVSYAISGAAGVYVNSVGLATETEATDGLGRAVVLKKSRLLSPDEWAQVLRAANLQLSVALAVSMPTKDVKVILPCRELPVPQMENVGLIVRTGAPCSVQYLRTWGTLSLLLSGSPCVVFTAATHCKGAVRD